MIGVAISYGAGGGLVRGPDDDHAGTARFARLVKEGTSREKYAAGLKFILMSEMVGMDSPPVFSRGGGL